jgi:hypothetical protein
MSVCSSFLLADAICWYFVTRVFGLALLTIAWIVQRCRSCRDASSRPYRPRANQSASWPFSFWSGPGCR